MLPPHSPWCSKHVPLASLLIYQDCISSPCFFSTTLFFYKSVLFCVKEWDYFGKQGKSLLCDTSLLCSLTVCSLAGLWGLVNNAGISTFGEVEFATLDNYKNVAEINLWGTVRVTKAFLPLIRRAKGMCWAMWQDSERAFAAQRRDVTKNHDSGCASRNVCAVQGGCLRHVSELDSRVLHAV